MTRGRLSKQVYPNSLVEACLQEQAEVRVKERRNPMKSENPSGRGMPQGPRTWWIFLNQWTTQAYVGLEAQAVETTVRLIRRQWKVEVPTASEELPLQVDQILERGERSGKIQGSNLPS